MNRRHFLIQTALIAVSTPSLANTLSLEQWQTLAAVQAHLFPSEPNSPGAPEINATGYLHFALIDPDEREFIKMGVFQLDRLAQYMEGKGFLALSTAQRELLLRRFEMGKNGKRWLTIILEYILEALLTDPIYGGNPNGIGWKWLDHHPGFPRPPANKRYYLL